VPQAGTSTESILAAAAQKVGTARWFEQARRLHPVALVGDAPRHAHYAGLVMMRIIRGHNRLNGLRFSVVEFGVVALVAVVLAADFFLSGAALVALVALGIATNCAPVVLLGIGSIRAGEPDIGLRAMLRPAVRAEALREYPSMQRDTYILAGATLLPFVVAIAVATELVAGRRS
jgi:hypothetical protein